MNHFLLKSVLATYAISYWSLQCGKLVCYSIVFDTMDGSIIVSMHFQTFIVQSIQQCCDISLSYIYNDAP